MAANCSQWLVLPTPGVPVIIILGWALEGMFVSLDRYFSACLCNEHTLCRSITSWVLRIFSPGAISLNWWCPGRLTRGAWIYFVALLFTGLDPHLKLLKRAPEQVVPAPNHGH